MNKPKEVEIGYLCAHGHYVFHGVGEDTCGTKRIGTITVEPDRDVEFSEPEEVRDEKGRVIMSHSGFSESDWGNVFEWATESLIKREEAWRQS